MVRVYTEEQLERNRIRKKEYYEANRVKILEKRKEYDENNKEKRKKYYEDNKEHFKEYNKEYRENKKESYREYYREYYLNNPHLRRVYTNKRRASKIQATPTWAELDEIKEFYRNCPADYHVDHIVPLRSDIVCGLHVISNLQYLPAAENLAKSNKLLEEYL